MGSRLERARKSSRNGSGKQMNFLQLPENP
jgi:hypothetical protein